MILAVDRDSHELEQMSTWLEGHGHDLLCANSVIQAIRWLQTVRPEVILLDVAGLHGFEVYRWLREQAPYRQVPVIFLVAADQRWDGAKAQTIHENYLLVKPLTPAKFAALLIDLFGSKVFMGRVPGDGQAEPVHERKYLPAWMVS